MEGSKMSMIAIITARGGSKRIPRKNIKNFMGKPMIAYAIDAARKSGLFDTVMVSTEDLDIADIAKKCGAEVPFLRSEKTSSDFATTYDVLEEVVVEYGKLGKRFDWLCCLYPCVPLLSPESLKNAYRTMLDANANAVQPVCLYPSPIEWAMRISNGMLVPMVPSDLKIRSQDLEPKFFDAGMFYFCKTDVLLKEKTLVPSRTAGYVINEMECQDIDTVDDWNIAELKFRIQKGV